MDTTNPNKQPIRGSQPDPRTRPNRQSQSAPPPTQYRTRSVSPPLQSAAPQSIPPQSVPPQSAPPQTQSVSELSEAAQRAIDPSQPMTDVVATIGTTKVHRNNLRRLLIGQSSTEDMWLDDEVINFYLACLMDRANAHRNLPKLYCFSSQFFQSINPNSWARRVNPFNMDLILFPVCVNSLHWVLVAVSPTNKTIIYYDSTYGNGEAVRAKILRFLKVRFHTQTGQPLNVTEWTSKDEKSLPRQTNNIDCGVFLCQIAERLSRRSSFDFNQTQMPAIRNQMIEQIVARVIPIPTRPQVISPPRSDAENTVQRPGRFDMPKSERIKRLENELRKLRAQFATQESEFNQFKENANQQLDATINAIRNETEVEIQKLKSELSEAHHRLEVLTSLGEQTESEQPRSDLFQVASSVQTEQVTIEEASTQTEQPTPDSAQPMFEEYLDNLDEACTNPKTHYSETNENQWPDLLSTES